MFKFFSVSLAMVAGALVTSAHAGGHGRPAGDDAAVITEWNAIAEGVVPTSAGPVLARNYSMMHIAMFDAVNAIEGGYQAYRVRLPASRFASSEAAAAQAAHDVLVSLQPAGTATYDAALAARLAKIPAGRAQYGVQIGREVAKKVLQWRLNDGWETPQSYTPPALPGLWQPTPPNFPTAAFVQAGDSKPLAVPTPYYFMPRRPPALNSQEYADAVDDIMEIGGVTSAVRTAEQTLQARLWASVGYVTNWGGAWNQVARDLARARKLSIVDSARLFVLLNVSMQDAVHTAQASKFVFQLWRPVHAIRRASEDMNDATTGDPTWLPLLTTPPYPSYMGNMACIGASAARSLQLYFGRDNINFTVQWTGIAPNADVARPFTGFWQLAEHQAMSREYGGIHFHFDTTASQEVCPKVANYVYANYMRPRRD